MLTGYENTGNAGLDVVEALDRMPANWRKIIRQTAGTSAQFIADAAIESALDGTGFVLPQTAHLRAAEKDIRAKIKVLEQARRYIVAREAEKVYGLDVQY